MRIDSLELIAFGPFTDAALDLSAGHEGLHVVYGPNEAGKSSALRALRALLFGISDAEAFVHTSAKLRVGGRLRTSGGETLEVIRRRGRKATLRGPDDKTVVPDAELTKLVQGASEEQFRTMFALGHEDLVHGGRIIASGGGDLGRLVFAAGSGLANVEEVLGALRSEADALFVPRGQKQTINAAIGQLGRLGAELKSAQLSAEAWERERDRLDRSEQDKATVEAALAEAVRAKSRLERTRDALPIIAERAEALARLQAVADAPLLDVGFAERRAEAVQQLAAARAARERTAATIAELEQELAGLGDATDWLERADAVDRLSEELGTFSKAARDRVGLEARRKAALSDAERILHDLGEELSSRKDDPPALSRPLAARIQELGTSYGPIVALIDETRATARERAARATTLAAERSQLPEAMPVDELRHRLELAEQAVAVERHLGAARQELEALRERCVDDQERLSLGGTELAQIGRLPVPSVETLRAFEERFDALERKRATLQDQQREADAQRQELEQQVEQARLTQEVPTEDDLGAARRRRDELWRALRAGMMGGASEASVGPEDEGARGVQRAALDTFEGSVREADDLADRLRREADRVAAKAQRLATLTAVRERLRSLGQESEQVSADRAALEQAWRAEWSGAGIDPRSPREMLTWRTELGGLLERARHAAKQGAEVERMAREIADHSGALAESLRALGVQVDTQESLTSLVRRARDRLTEQTELAHRHQGLRKEQRELDSEIESTQGRLDDLEARLEAWRVDWERAVAPLGLGATTSPAEATAVIEGLRAVSEKQQEAADHLRRIEGIDRDAAVFAREVADLAAAIAPELDGRPPTEAVRELQRRLKAAQATESRRQRAEKQRDDEANHRRTADSIVVDAELRLQALCAEAGCESPSELPDAERRAAERRKAQAELDETGRRLGQLSGGLSVSDFVRDVSSEDLDAIVAEIDRLAEQIDQLKARRSTLDQTIGSARSELDRHTGSDDAARVAEQIQAIHGSLDGHLEQYARLTIARLVLHQALERFRQRSQDPIVTRASELLRATTCGSFQGLRVELDTDGKPELRAVRAESDDAVALRAMSDGTADQLFLALRLAGLEHYLETHEPMPFIVDDILVQFDDERSAATLGVLGELSRKTQVVLFTHHRHLVDLAGRAVDPDLLHVHELGS